MNNDLINRAFSAEREHGFREGVGAAIAIMEERGERVGGAVQPRFTAMEIRERLFDV